MNDAGPYPSLQGSPRGHTVRAPAEGHGSWQGRLVILSVLLLACLSRTSLLGAEDPFLTRSVSGQFLISYRPSKLPPLSVPRLETNLAFIRLDATLLPISCERIRQSVWRELGITGNWRSKIYIGLRPVTGPEDTVTIASERFRDGWQYRVDLPDLVERTRYLRAMVQVLLLEFANRNAQDRSAEIPPWLVEGLIQELLLARDAEVMVPPPRTVANSILIRPTELSARMPNPLEAPHVFLSTNSVLSFDQLSWPKPEDFDGPTAELYRNCALLFIHSLANLPDGTAGLLAMLQRLPDYLNWQFAFLQAFPDYFQRPLDVEKWWALQTVHFTRRTLAQQWKADHSWERLVACLRTPVEFHSSTNQSSLQKDVSLQTIIGDWQPDQQTLALRRVIGDLANMEPRVAPQLASIVYDYRQALERYLERREHPGVVLPFRKRAAQRQNVEDTLRRLDALDTQARAFGSATDITVEASSNRATAAVR